MSLKFTIMGSGNSTGVPAIGNYWGKCDPNESRNRRTRSSILVQSATTNLVIDTGADFREQLNKTDVTAIDAILYTHHHSDHVNGIDELRMIARRMGKMVQIYGNIETLDDIRSRFKYLFEGKPDSLYPTILETNIMKDFGRRARIGDIDFVPFEQDHVNCISVGFRFGDVAYSPDFHTLDFKAVEALKGVKTWIVDAAGYNDENNPVHANLKTIAKLNEQIGATQLYLMSLTLAMDYQTLLKELPPGWLPAHDGLVFTG